MRLWHIVRPDARVLDHRGTESRPYGLDSSDFLLGLAVSATGVEWRVVGNQGCSGENPQVGFADSLTPK